MVLGSLLWKVTTFPSNLTHPSHTTCLLAPGSRCSDLSHGCQGFVRGSWRLWLTATYASARSQGHEGGGKVMPIPGDAVTQICPVPWEELISPMSSALCQVLTLPINVQYFSSTSLYLTLQFDRGVHKHMHC